jgi:predicted membrane channel-forming protein YqfA (hemolysin III family)
MSLSGAGGTPGGVGTFLAGFCLSVAGGYLLVDQVTVQTGYWQLFGINAFGLALLPFVVGVGMLFFNADSKLGWLLLIAGLVIIVAGILANLTVYFRPTSLFNTLMMLAMLGGGIGLLVRSFRSS